MIYSYYSHIHRFMRFKLSEFEGLVAKTDFRSKEQAARFDAEFKNLLILLAGHGKHEDDVYHKMLEQKGSTTQNESEQEHQQQAVQLDEMQALALQIAQTFDPKLRVEIGYQFYLKFTNFLSDYMKHLIREELVLMPELHRLYSVDELRSVTFNTYRKMTQEQLHGMLEVLFPFVNAVERETFLTDIKDGTPKKFPAAWAFISSKLAPEELLALSAKFGFDKSRSRPTVAAKL